MSLCFQHPGKFRDFAVQLQRWHVGVSVGCQSTDAPRHGTARATHPLSVRIGSLSTFEPLDKFFPRNLDSVSGTSATVTPLNGCSSKTQVTFVVSRGVVDIHFDAAITEFHIH